MKPSHEPHTIGRRHPGYEAPVEPRESAQRHENGTLAGIIRAHKKRHAPQIVESDLFAERPKVCNRDCRKTKSVVLRVISHSHSPRPSGLPAETLGVPWTRAVRQYSESWEICPAWVEVRGPPGPSNPEVPH